MPVSRVSRRWAACRHLRVKAARRSRMVALKRSIKDVLNCLHPLVMVSKCCAFSRVPQVSLCVTSTTRFFFVCLITVAIQSWGQTANLALPWFHGRLMHLVAVLSGSLLPIGDRAFIQAIGMHNRLDGASIAE